MHKCYYDIHLEVFRLGKKNKDSTKKTQISYHDVDI